MLDGTDLKSMLKDPSLLETRAYIGGVWTDGDDGIFDVTNPARGDVVAQVANLSRAQVAGAIAQAEAAQKDWKISAESHRSCTYPSGNMLVIGVNGRATTTS